MKTEQTQEEKIQALIERKAAALAKGWKDQLAPNQRRVLADEVAELVNEVLAIASGVRGAIREKRITEWDKARDYRIAKVSTSSR